MLKTLAVLRVVTLIFVITSIIGCTSQAQQTPLLRKSIDNKTTKNRKQVFSLILLPVAKATLNKGGSITGQLTEITAQNIKLERGGKSSIVLISDIKLIEFSQEKAAPSASAREQVIRGEEIWRINPITALKIKDGNRGQAELNINAIVKELAPPQNPIISPTNYQINQIWFDSQSPQIMRIKVTPIK